MRNILLSGFIIALLFPAPGVAQDTAKAAEQPVIMSSDALLASLLLNAEKGQGKAMLHVGLFYERISSPRNFTKALEWYQKAALAGEREGYLRLGDCWEIGMGAVADMDKAVAAYEKAAQMGETQSLYKLAMLYLMGRGVPKNEANGLELLKKAAEGGNGVAANELAAVYLKGMFGQKEDGVKARVLYLKSAEAGNLEGIKNLAFAVRDGLGGQKPPNPVQGLRWFITAQKGGLRSPEVDGIIDELKKQLQPAQIKKAEEEADKWLTDLTARLRQKNVQ